MENYRLYFKHLTSDWRELDPDNPADDGYFTQALRESNNILEFNKLIARDNILGVKTVHDGLYKFCWQRSDGTIAYEYKLVAKDQ